MIFISPPKAWPKPHLLEIYRRAVEEGCVRVGEGQMTEEVVASLRQAFYRLRRRSDAQHASFILPEYHLVSCVWEPERKAALFVYSSLPDGMALPEIASVPDAVRLEKPLQPPVMHSLPETKDATDFDAEAFVQGLVDEAGQRLEKDVDEGGTFG